jgi:hypothetical protein
MKKSIRSLTLVLVLLSISICYSQNFKAKDGLNSAVSNSGLSNPELMVCGTFNGSVQGSPVPLTFDINSGVANAWLYYFRSADDNNQTKLMIVSKLFNNYIAISLPVNQLLDSLPFEPAGSLNELQWLDSDVMAENLRNSPDYQDYKTAHNDAAISLVTLSYNGDYPYIPIGSAYWIAKIDASNTASLLCAVNALNGEVTCFDEPSAVKDNNQNEVQLNVYPNPSQDNLFIAIPDGISISCDNLKIYDSAGKMVYCFNVKLIAGINLITIPTNLFSNGQYFIEMPTKRGMVSGKFVIDR